MTTIVKATDAAHFLSLVPRMFGFTPRHSVVVVPFADGRSVGGMRVDLPPGRDVDAVAATLVGMVCRVDGADAFMLVVYDDVDSTTFSAGGRLAKAFRSRGDACGLRVMDALHVGPTRWRSSLDPAIGGDLADLPAPGGEDPPPDGDQRSGAELVPASPERVAQVASAAHELMRAMGVLMGAPADDGDRPDHGCRIDPAALAATVLLDDLPLFFDGCAADPTDAPAGTTNRARHPDVPEVYAQAALLWCLDRPSLRDIALATWLGGLEVGDRAVEGQLLWQDGEDYPSELAQRMWGEGTRPDADRLLAALQACRNAAGVAPEESRPGALAACAWLSWALGRLTHAEIYARAACEIEPEHGLATIMLTFVDAGHLPDWAFHR